MPITPTKKIWMDGELVDWDDATIHILNPTLHYGWGVFEGIRAYATDRGPAVFRLTEHIERLFRSAHIYMMEPDLTSSRSSRRPRRRCASTRSSPATSARCSTWATARWASTRCRARPPRRSRAGRGAPTSATRPPTAASARVCRAAHRPQRHPAGGQGHRPVHQLLARQGRRAQGRLRRGDHPDPRGHGLRGLGREHLRRLRPESSPRRWSTARSPASPATRS